jgi:tRNA1Val (adenine37-N6)-methyltransferase
LVARTNRVFHQPARGDGYRANVDAYHLARFAGARTAQVCFDLGSGAGAVALTLLELDAAARVVLVEIDTLAAELATKNLSDNGWNDRGTVHRGDVLDVGEAHRGQADLVVCNPPYVEPGRGRAPQEPARARARQGSLGRFVEASRAVLGHRGRVCFVYPAHEAMALFGTLRAAGIEPKRLRAVHARAEDPARLVLVEGRAGKSGGLMVEPPLVEIEKT